jgi:hypothetical protein
MNFKENCKLYRSTKNVNKVRISSVDLNERKISFVFQNKQFIDILNPNIFGESE